MTESARAALTVLRDPMQMEWYSVPLIAFVLYVYANEVEKRNWNLILAGLAFYGIEWAFEVANSLVQYFTGHAAVWIASRKTSYMPLVGINLEITFMFAVAGVVLTKMLPKEKQMRILGIPNRLFMGLCFSIFCAGVEVWLNHSGLLTWEWPWWSWPHVWLVPLFGYLPFMLYAWWVFDMESMRKKIIVVVSTFVIDAVAIWVFAGLLKWI